MTNTPKPGTIGWHDLTVPDAEIVRDFYASVIGWTFEPVDMGGYSDYNMIPPGGTPVAGVCHQRGTNADIPTAWIVYFVVADVDESVEQVRQCGGAIVAGPKGEGGHRYAIIKDPAGAVCALYQSG
jgi:hypothetical protein